MTNYIHLISSDVEKNADEIEDFLVQMLKINATNPTMGGPGEIERANFLQRFLNNMGLNVARMDAPDLGSPGGIRPNLTARLEQAKAQTLWYVAHMDTVPAGDLELWKADPFEPLVRDGKIFARGAEDNGQDLAAVVFALRELHRLDLRLPFNIGLAIVSDEEVASKFGAKYLLDHCIFAKKDLAVVPDVGSRSGLEIETVEKHKLWLRVRTVGKQVHGSEPRKGLNARTIGMQLALAIHHQLYRKYGKKNLRFTDEPSSTFEPTKVEPNVSNINTIPGKDVAYFDCRLLPDYSPGSVLSDIRAILNSFRKRYGIRATVEVVERIDSARETPHDSEIAVLVRKAVTAFLKQPEYVGSSGQTVANILREHGIPSVAWCKIDNTAHHPNEYCTIKNMILDTKVFATIPILASSGARPH